MQSALAEKRVAELAEGISIVSKKNQERQADEIKALQAIAEQSEEGKKKKSSNFNKSTRDFPSERGGNQKLLAVIGWPINRR